MTKELLVGFILGAIIGIIIALIIKLRSMIIELKSELSDSNVQQTKIIHRLPNRIMIEEGVGEVRGAYKNGGFEYMFAPIWREETIFIPTKTNIYDLIDFKDEIYDNIVKLQVVQQKDLKEYHHYYRVTHVSMLEERTEYYYIGAPIIEEKKPRIKSKKTQEETKIEKEENN